jgi:hypothetical protein
LRRALRPQASPSNQPPTCIGCWVLRFCQRSTFDFFRSLNPPAVPSTNCQLALAINLSAVPANQLSDLGLRFDPPVCLPAELRLAPSFSLSAVPVTNFRLSAGHQLERTLGLPNLCMQVQNSGFLCITSFVALLVLQSSAEVRF